MSEQVIRHRGGGRDDDGKLIPWDDPGVLLTPIAVAPGSAGGSSRGSAGFVERAREGETIACAVYFRLGTDLTNDDELTVRGERFSIIVNDWRLGGRGGLEVLCARGQG